MRIQTIWPIVILLSTVSVVITTVWDLDYSARPMLLLWFILVCPGMAVVRLLRIDQQGMELMVAIAVSVVITMTIAMVTVYAGYWSSLGTVATLALICVAGACFQLIRINGAMNSDQAR